MQKLILWGASLFAAATAYSSEGIDFDQDIFPIIQTNCMNCHNSSWSAGEVSLESLEEVLANKEAALAALEEGRMPLGNPEFKDSEVGQLLIQWLQSQQDTVEPEPEPEPTPEPTE